ncbi:MAG: hypothetical protein ABI620_06830 [Chloroflexota bacterium]
MLTYAGRGRWAGAPAGKGGRRGVATHAGARSTSTSGNDGEIATISRLQATAGNRAVTELLTAQREDDKQPAAPKPDPKTDKAALRKAWADAGLVAGGPLFDAINADLSVDSLVTMALPGLVGLANEGAAAGFAKGTEDTKGEVKGIGLDKKEAGAATGAVTGWAQKGAETWLKGPDGKKFLAKLQDYINKHPEGAYWTIVGTLAAAISGAVIAYFAGAIDPKEFKKKFEVKGLTIDAAVDLGKFQERVLQSAKLALSGKAGPGTLAIEGNVKTVTDKKESGYELGATGSYALGDEKKGPSAKLSGGYAYNTLKDESSASVGANMKFKPLTIDTTFKFQGDGSGVLDTSVVGKLADNLTLSAGATGGVYGPAESKAPVAYKLALTSTSGKENDKVTLDVNPNARIVTFGTEQTRNLWGGSLTTSIANGAGTTAGLSFARNALKADLKYTLDKAGAASLDIGASGKAEGIDAAFAGKFGLETGQLEKLTVHLGFTSPDETLKFLHDMSIEISAGKVDAKSTETIKLRLKQIAVEVEGSVGQKDDKATGSVRAEVGWKLPSGLIIGVGAQATNTGGTGKAPTPWLAGPMVSVSHEALPVRLTGGVFTPIDAAAPTPPVFALGVSGNFDFASGKKK